MTVCNWLDCALAARLVPHPPFLRWTFSSMPFSCMTSRRYRITFCWQHHDVRTSALYAWPPTCFIHSSSRPGPTYSQVQNTTNWLIEPTTLQRPFLM